MTASGAAWQLWVLVATVCWSVALTMPCKIDGKGEACGCPDLASEALMDRSSDGWSREDSEFYYIDDMAFKKRRRGTQGDYSEDVNTELNIQFWPGGLIFYVIDEKFSTKYRNEIRRAISTIEVAVGRQHLQFHDARTSSGKLCRSSYLMIERANEKHCMSQVGMTSPDVSGKTITKTWLNQDVCPQGTILHELMHALGRFHEQSRSDRNKHVFVNTSAILTSDCHNFARSTRSVDVDKSLLLNYDTNSIMHYGSCTFTCTGDRTIVTALGLPIEANRKEMTELDKQKLRVMYPASSKVPYEEAYCSGATAAHQTGLLSFTLCAIMWLLSSTLRLCLLV